MDALFHDVRLATRSLARSPGFTSIAAMCIALGIAANVFVWSPVNALLLRPLPYPASERLMQLSSYETTGRRETYGTWSFPDYDDATRALGDVFTGIGAITFASFNVGGSGEAERLSGGRVSASFFPATGVQPALGRFFRPDEQHDQRVVVIGYGLWERKFASDSAIVGRSIPIDGVAHEVIGVMARGMRIPEQEDLWLPLNPGEARAHRDWRFFHVIGRLAPGVTVAQADARVSTFMRTLAERYADTNRHRSAWVVPLNDLIAREVRPIFLTMLGAVGFVLLIACANVANLLLARGAGRQREMAVRMAMGASRWRVVRQLLTESFLLAAAGGAGGLLLGTWMVDLFITRMLPTTVPFWMSFDVDRTVVLVSVAVTAVTGLVFGVAPALHLSGASLAETINAAGARGASAGRRVGQMRRTLVVGELALSLILLVGAGLMVRSFLETQRARLGFDSRQLLTFELHFAGPRYGSDSARSAFVQLLEGRLAQLPGVEGVGAATQLPVARCCRTNAYFPDGKNYPLSGGPTAWFTRASSGFLAAMRVPLLDGRDFVPADLLPGSEPVAIVDSALAAREWPGMRAVGQRLRFGDPTAAGSALFTVVGVIPHLVERNVSERIGAQALLPLSDGSTDARHYALRTRGDPDALVPAVRAAVRAIDPDLPLAELATMEFVIRDRMFQPRVYGTMFALFAATALLLATIGLYGVMSYLVAQRTRELGVRMALGADQRAVLRLVMGNAGRLVVGGLLLGVPAAVACAQLLRGLLYGVSATDPMILLGLSAALATVALAASWIPARRATRVDPVTSLRADG